MKTSIRKRVGALVVLLSLLTSLVLHVSGVPLLSVAESHTSFFAGGALTSCCFDLHWPLAVVCTSAFLGVLAFVWPQRRPPRLQP
jgi:hypothetical protein